jgi:predicted nucleotidyltransferase component of viral defense system
MSDESLRNWVEAGTDARNKEFRQAVHTILRAISSIPRAAERIALKGAILLSIRYRFTRTTKDIDFSTARHYDTFDKNEFLDELSTTLTSATDELPYGLACKIHSHEIRPSHQGANYPTMEVRIGYAPKLDTRRLRRLLGPNGSPTRLTLDLSFNEPLCDLEILGAGSTDELLAYSLTDFVAEKLRAMLQQPVRNRWRPQDALDIYVLLNRQELHDPKTKSRILDTLRTKSDARDLTVEQQSMRDPEVRKRSARDYPTLASQIEIELPPFDKVFGAVTDYFESLPWKMTD